MHKDIFFLPLWFIDYYSLQFSSSTFIVPYLYQFFAEWCKLSIIILKNLYENVFTEQHQHESTKQCPICIFGAVKCKFDALKCWGMNYHSFWYKHEHFHLQKNPMINLIFYPWYTWSHQFHSFKTSDHRFTFWTVKQR